jgi:hypothetical protein
MQNRFVVSLAALASMAAVAPAFAQDAAAPAAANGGRTMEYGIDAGVSLNMGTPKVTTVSIPVGTFRAGFYVNDRVSLEPMVNFSSHSGGGASSYDYNAALGLLWHFHDSPVGNGPYIRPFAGFTGSHFSGGSSSGSSSDGLAGAGLGVKLPWGERMAWRFEANYTHVFESNNTPGFSNNNIGLNAGISYFVR